MEWNSRALGELGEKNRSEDGEKWKRKGSEGSARIFGEFGPPSQKRFKVGLREINSAALNRFPRLAHTRERGVFEMKRETDYMEERAQGNRRGGKKKAKEGTDKRKM